MKIAFITDAWLPVWGGGQVHVWEVAERLRETYDCKVDIIVPNLGDNNEVISLGPRFVFPNIFGRILFVFNSFWFCLTHHYNIYHSHSYSTSIFLPIVGVLLKRPVVFTLHGSGSIGRGAEIFNLFKIPAILDYIFVYLVRYDALISVAKKSLYQKPNTKLVKIIGNGVDLNKFDAVKTAKNFKHFTLLWVGRMVPLKGLNILLQVFKKFATSYPNLRLTLVGDGPERKNLENLVKSFKLEKKVNFIGAIPYQKFDLLIKQYKAADLFVLPSLASEGFPITILEAMAAKLPVIASDIGDTDLLIQNGKTGYLVEPGDVASLEKNIKIMITNTSCSEWGFNGYELVKNHYTWDIITQEIYEVYQKTLSTNE